MLNASKSNSPQAKIKVRTTSCVFFIPHTTKRSWSQPLQLEVHKQGSHASSTHNQNEPLKANRKRKQWADTRSCPHNTHTICSFVFWRTSAAARSSRWQLLSRIESLGKPWGDQVAPLVIRLRHARDVEP